MNVIDKVNRLRELSRSSNVHEAAAAAAAAARLMERHGLDEALLEAQSSSPGEEARQADEPLVSWSGARVPQWQRLLAWGLVRHYDCAGIETNMRGRTGTGQTANIKVVGRAADIANVRYMYAWLSIEILRLSQSQPVPPRERARSWRDRWRHGAVLGCLQSMGTEKKRVRDEAQPPDGSHDEAVTAALVVIDARRAAADAEVERLYPRAGKARSIGKRGGAAFRDGHARGRLLGGRGKALPSLGGRLLTS